MIADRSSCTKYDLNLGPASILILLGGENSHPVCHAHSWGAHASLSLSIFLQPHQHDHVSRKAK